MSLIEQTLFGEVDRVQQAIDRLKQYELDGGYYLAFSEGKNIKTIFKMKKIYSIGGFISLPKKIMKHTNFLIKAKS